jgi:hypothetical protein
MSALRPSSYRTLHLLEETERGDRRLYEVILEVTDLQDKLLERGDRMAWRERLRRARELVREHQNKT